MKTNNNYKTNTTLCEILAPAGTYETMIAAFNAGADAVYVGGEKFGARAFAGNFLEKELLKAINYAHFFGKKLYLTINTLIKESEFDELYDFIKPYYEKGLDAVIIQDLGVIDFISKKFKDLPIHCSTQMTITAPNYAAALKKNPNITRIVTPRELNLSEIKDIYNATGLEIESFVHGALCYCYSGQCLLSSMIGGRSGNRGRCAQPCRLPYTSENFNIKNKHLLSPKDLCTLNILPDILKSGVYSLKIEGRMKKPEYVASVVAMYRKYVDLYYKAGKNSYKVDEEDITTLKEIYNRGGFTDGFYMQQNGKELMSMDRPNHCGVKVGEVIASKKNSLKVKTLRNINKGDVLELSDGTEFFAPYDIKKADVFEYRFKNHHIIPPKTTVIRTRNEVLVKDIISKYLYNEKGELITLKRKINIDICLKSNCPICAVMWDNEYSVTVYGENPQSAMNKPITTDDVKKQLSKLGGTDFSIDSINVTMEDKLFVPISEFNEIRRELIIKFTEKLHESFERQHFDEEIKFNINEKTDKKATDKNATDKISVLVLDKEQLDAVFSYFTPDRIYIEYANFSPDELKEIIDRLKETASEVFVALPYIVRNRALNEFSKHIDIINKFQPDGYLFRNLESYYYFLNNNVDVGRVVFDSNIYAMNNSDIYYYKSIGANEITASYETNRNEFEMLDTSCMEMNIYGYIPVMLSAGCIQKNLDKCALKASDESKPLNIKALMSRNVIRDRKNNRFTIINVCRFCYNIMYNSVPLSLLNQLEEVRQLGFKSLRINFTVENREEVLGILGEYSRIKNDVNIKTGFQNDTLEGNIYTKGHFRRGVE